ncbi:MAG: anion permease [Clostridiales bacterium]|nr:anion permease [Clostridiales bacterium]
MATSVNSHQHKHHFHVGAFVKKYAMPIIAVTLALITCIFVPFDKAYLGYFDLSTLATLFCTLAVVSAFKNIRFFTWLAKKIVLKFGNLRNTVFALVFVTYFGSMVMANDMALITFLPLGYVALDSCNRRDKMPIVFVMQNVAANLGGMLTPFGNPQNIYLFGFYQLNTVEFLRIMALPCAVALLLIVGVCLFVKKDKIQLYAEQEKTPSTWRSIVYAALFVLSVLIVFDVLPWYIVFAIVIIAMLALDYKALGKVDYGLLLTFTAFFVFSGNLARIDAINDILSKIVSTSPLLVGVASCQFISNVPTAVLLSKFTTDYSNLIVAVNIGGLGTPIASLASLITLNEFKKNNPTGIKRYLAVFFAINFSFLIVLMGAQLLAMLF